MYPFALVAGALALYFTATAIERRRAADVLAAVLWSAYAVYEYHVANGTLCDPYCNIRVDLVLFLPLLGFATFLALGKAPRNVAVLALAVICLGMAGLLAVAFGNVAVAVAAGSAALVVVGWAVRSRFSGTSS